MEILRIFLVTVWIHIAVQLLLELHALSPYNNKPLVPPCLFVKSGKLPRDLALVSWSLLQHPTLWEGEALSTLLGGFCQHCNHCALSEINCFDAKFVAWGLQDV